MISDELKAEFRKGFYADKPAYWLDRFSNESQPVTPKVGEHIRAISEGKRNFAYPGHDAVVFSLLRSLITRHNLQKGADIGCATGCFPAMQIACGIRSCTIFDVRPLDIDHPQINIRIQDLSTDDGLRPEYDIITCLSTIEHVGLGRYGDPIDPWGDIRLANNLRQLVNPGGIVLMSFPVGLGTVVYNAHRIYSSYRINKLFQGYELIRKYSDLSLFGKAQRELKSLLKGKKGRFQQPIYVLRVKIGSLRRPPVFSSTSV